MSIRRERVGTNLDKCPAEAGLRRHGEPRSPEGVTWPWTLAACVAPPPLTPWADVAIVDEPFEQDEGELRDVERLRSLLRWFGTEAAAPGAQLDELILSEELILSDELRPFRSTSRRSSPA